MGMKELSSLMWMTVSSFGEDTAKMMKSSRCQRLSLNLQLNTASDFNEDMFA